MIYVNEHKINNSRFPDATLLLKYDPYQDGRSDSAKIKWFYDNDEELFVLYCLTRHLQNHGVKNIHLIMPYIPNARQDRVKNSDDIFTLKYFCEIINSLNFSSVKVLDPHSNVSEALINNLIKQNPASAVEMVLRNLDTVPTLFYPDEGAMKRYSGLFAMSYCFGMKKRDWVTGQIEGLDIIGDIALIENRDVLIIDDICSKGGTFLHSAKKLKELGAKNIYLYVSHCESTVLTGELINSDLIDKIYTTNSICRCAHEKIKIFDL